MSVRGFIDQPPSDDLPLDLEIGFAGWTVRSNRPAAGVLLFIEDVPCVSPDIDLAQPDVAAALVEPGIEMCGLSCRVPADIMQAIAASRVINLLNGSTTQQMKQ